MTAVRTPAELKPEIDELIRQAKFFNKPEDLDQIITSALENKPTTALLHNIGLCFLRLGQIDMAISVLKQTCAYDSAYGTKNTKKILQIIQHKKSLEEASRLKLPPRGKAKTEWQKERLERFNDVIMRPFEARLRNLKLKDATKKREIRHLFYSIKSAFCAGDIIGARGAFSLLLAFINQIENGIKNPFCVELLTTLLITELRFTCMDVKLQTFPPTSQYASFANPPTVIEEKANPAELKRKEELSSTPEMLNRTIKFYRSLDDLNEDVALLSDKRKTATERLNDAAHCLLRMGWAEQASLAFHLVQALDPKATHPREYIPFIAKYGDDIKKTSHWETLSVAIAEQNSTHEGYLSEHRHQYSTNIREAISTTLNTSVSDDLLRQKLYRELNPFCMKMRTNDINIIHHGLPLIHDIIACLPPAKQFEFGADMALQILTTGLRLSCSDPNLWPPPADMTPATAETKDATQSAAIAERPVETSTTTLVESTTASPLAVEAKPLDPPPPFEEKDEVNIAFLTKETDLREALIQLDNEAKTSSLQQQLDSLGLFCLRTGQRDIAHTIWSIGSSLCCQSPNHFTPRLDLLKHGFDLVKATEVPPARAITHTTSLYRSGAAEIKAQFEEKITSQQYAPPRATLDRLTFITTLTEQYVLYGLETKCDPVRFNHFSIDYFDPLYPHSIIAAKAQAAHLLFPFSLDYRFCEIALENYEKAHTLAAEHHELMAETKDPYYIEKQAEVKNLQYLSLATRDYLAGATRPINVALLEKALGYLTKAIDNTPDDYKKNNIRLFYLRACISERLGRPTRDDLVACDCYQQEIKTGESGNPKLGYSIKLGEFARLNLKMQHRPARSSDDEEWVLPYQPTHELVASIRQSTKEFRNGAGKRLANYQADLSKIVEQATHALARKKLPDFFAVIQGCEDDIRAELLIAGLRTHINALYGHYRNPAKAIEPNAVVEAPKAARQKSSPPIRRFPRHQPRKKGPSPSSHALIPTLTAPSSAAAVTAEPPLTWQQLREIKANLDEQKRREARKKEHARDRQTILERGRERKESAEKEAAAVLAAKTASVTAATTTTPRATPAAVTALRYVISNNFAPPPAKRVVVTEKKAVATTREGDGAISLPTLRQLLADTLLSKNITHLLNVFRPIGKVNSAIFMCGSFVYQMRRVMRGTPSTLEISDVDWIIACETDAQVQAVLKKFEPTQTAPLEFAVREDEENHCYHATCLLPRIAGTQPLKIEIVIRKPTYKPTPNPLYDTEEKVHFSPKRGQFHFLPEQADLTAFLDRAHDEKIYHVNFASLDSDYTEMTNFPLRLMKLHYRRQADGIQPDEKVKETLFAPSAWLATFLRNAFQQDKMQLFADMAQLSQKIPPEHKEQYCNLPEATGIIDSFIALVLFRLFKRTDIIAIHCDAFRAHLIDYWTRYPDGEVALISAISDFFIDQNKKKFSHEAIHFLLNEEPAPLMVSHMSMLSPRMDEPPVARHLAITVT